MTDWIEYGGALLELRKEMGWRPDRTLPDGLWLRYENEYGDEATGAVGSLRGTGHSFGCGCCANKVLTDSTIVYGYALVVPE